MAHLEEINVVERGEVFTMLELKYTLPGTIHCTVFLKFFEEMPRVDFRMELGKTISTDIESVFLPMTLSLDDHQALYLKKGPALPVVLMGKTVELAEGERVCASC